MDKELAKGRNNTDDDSAKLDSKSLVNLPPELLVKIFSYLPICDKIKVRHVSRMFRDVSETPLLWREFVWPDYEPRHVCIVSIVLKACGEHVRRLSFPAHVGSKAISRMASYCTKVTHLSIPKHTRLSMSDLEEIVGAMSHLQQLDVFSNMQPRIDKLARMELERDDYHRNRTERFLKITAAKELKLRIDCDLMHELKIIQKWADQGNSLPSVITILTEDDNEATDMLLEFWSASSSKLVAFEISMYDSTKVPLNLHPSIPLRKFKFCPAAKPPCIKLSYHGIVGLKYDAFYLSDYDHYGKVRHSMIPSYRNIQEEHLHYITAINLVTNVDFSGVGVHSNHLEQLAVACPHLQQLNLKDNVNCLESIQGLQAIIYTCQNLQGLNLMGISVSSVKSHLLLWELLSRVERLTHLAINLCMMTPQVLDDVTKQILIGMLKSCRSLQALELHCDHCSECNSMFINDLLFPYFPSLAHFRMSDFQYPVFKYAIANCQRLKYFYEYHDYFSYNAHRFREWLLTSSCSCSCRLQQLCITSRHIDLTDEMANVLSAHGELESVVLSLKSITIDAINTLVTNSPKLNLLQIMIKKTPFKDNYCPQYAIFLTDITRTVKQKLLHPKFFVTDNFRVLLDNRCSTHPDADRNSFKSHMNSTDLNSLWTSVDNSVIFNN